MALVTPSTTFVEINALQTPYTPVLFSEIVYTGQTVSVIDRTGNPSIVENPIVASTISGYFQEQDTTKTSTLINQPLGFITVQSILPSTWNFINSYPFRDQSISAGVLNITASSIYTALSATSSMNISTVFVENLLVTGEYIQTSPLAFIGDVTTTGAVTFLSSLEVWRNVYLSSQLSSFGYAQFISSIDISGDLFVSSPIQTTTSLYVGSTLSALGSLSTSELRLQGSILGTTADVQLNSVTTDVAGSLNVATNMTINNSANFGGSLQTLNLEAGTANITSSFATAGILNVANTTNINNNLNVFNTATIYGPLNVNHNSVLAGNVYARKNLYVKNDLDVKQNLYAQAANIASLTLHGDFSNTSNIASLYNLSTGGRLGLGTFTASTTSIQGTTTVLSNLAVGGDFLIEQEAYIQGPITTNQLVAGGDISGFQNATLNSVYLSSSATFLGDLGIANAFSTANTYVVGDVSIIGDVTVTSRFIISSIVLPDILTSSNMYVSTFNTGYDGIVSSVQISTLFVSSVAGNLPYAAYPFDLSGTLSTPTLEANYMSVGKLLVNPNSNPSSYFYVTSSLGVNTGIDASSNTVNINTDAYLLKTTLVYNEVSSFTVTGEHLIGAHVGDGSQLYNVNYDQSLSSAYIKVSSVAGEFFNMSSFYTSSGTLYNQIFGFSTLQIGQAYIVEPDPLSDPYLNQYQSNTIFTSQNLYGNGLFINSLNTFYQAPFTKKAYINVQNPPINSPFALEVNGTTIIRDLISPNFIVNLRNLYASTLTVSSMNAPIVNPGYMFIASGTIGISTGAFFIGEQESILLQSTNTVQPLLSSLVFNQSLFVKKDTKNVGVSLSSPTYTLDVSGSMRSDGSSLIEQVFISDQIQENQMNPSFWLGTGSSNGLLTSNLRFSPDGEAWTSNINLPSMKTLFTVAYNGSLWVGAGNAGLSNYTIQYSKNLVDWSPSYGNVFQTNYPPRSVAWNGNIWVAVGATRNISLSNRSIAYSVNGSNWRFSSSGGFNNSSSNGGGYSVAWNGKLWVAAGVGGTAANSLQYSTTGRSWLNSKTGGFTSYGVTWAERNWVAVGQSTNTTNTRIKTSTDGSNWLPSYVELNGGKATSVAYGAGTLVVTRSNATGNTILYSQDFGNTWEPAIGDLFALQGLSVNWNGEFWIAGGNDGVRKSYDGIAWYNPVGSPTYAFYGIGYSSNLSPFLNINDTASLEFYQNPLPNILTLTSSSVITFSQEGMAFNSLNIDNCNNVTIPYAATQYENSNNNFVSTFIVFSGAAVFSTSMSTAQVIAGSLYLGSQTV
jgi:cytoskeletal protein CcmA (bactofilin family)